MMPCWLVLNSILSIAAKPPIEEPFFAMIETCTDRLKAWSQDGLCIESKIKKKVERKIVPMIKCKRDIYPVGGHPSLSNLPLVVAEVAAEQKSMNACNNKKLSFIIHSLSLSLLKTPLTNEKNWVGKSQLERYNIWESHWTKTFSANSGNKLIANLTTRDSNWDFFSKYRQRELYRSNLNFRGPCDSDK